MTHELQNSKTDGSPDGGATELSDEQFASAMMAQLEPIQPSPDLSRRVAEIPLRHAKERAGFWPFEKMFQPLFALVGAAALGVLIGAQDGLLDLGQDAPAVSATTVDPSGPEEDQLPGASSSASALPAGPKQAGAQPEIHRTPEAAATAEASGATEAELAELEREFLLAFGEPWEEDAWLEGETL